MTAAQVLLVDRLVAGAAVGGRHAGGDDEAMMVVAFLSIGGLMTLQTVDLLACVNAQLVFVDDRILQVGVALGALAGGAHEFGGGLLRYHARPIPVDRVSGHQQGSADDKSDKHGSKGHVILLLSFPAARLGSSRGANPRLSIRSHGLGVSWAALDSA